MYNTKRTALPILIGFSIVILGYLACVYKINHPTHITCIDGDTFAVGRTYYRLAYIDTPDEPTSVAGNEATCQYLQHNKIRLKSVGVDKYGRVLVEVNPNKYYSLNELLISECLAEPFWANTTDKIKDLYKLCQF